MIKPIKEIPREEFVSRALGVALATLEEAGGLFVVDTILKSIPEDLRAFAEEEMELTKAAIEYGSMAVQSPELYKCADK